MIINMNYTEPKMEITMFSAESVLTGSSALDTMTEGVYTGSVSYDKLDGTEQTLEFKK